MAPTVGSSGENVEIMPALPSYHASCQLCLSTLLVHPGSLVRSTTGEPGHAGGVLHHSLGVRLGQCGSMLARGNLSLGSYAGNLSAVRNLMMCYFCKQKKSANGRVSSPRPFKEPRETKGNQKQKKSLKSRFFFQLYSTLYIFFSLFLNKEQNFELYTVIK